MIHKSNEKFFVFVSHRMSPKNMLTCGLWCVPAKPNMQVYLNPFVEEINNIYECGNYFHIKPVTHSFPLSKRAMETIA